MESVELCRRIVVVKWHDNVTAMGLITCSISLLVGVGHCSAWQVTHPSRVVTSYLCRPLLHMSDKKCSKIFLAHREVLK